MFNCTCNPEIWSCDSCSLIMQLFVCMMKETCFKTWVCKRPPVNNNNNNIERTTVDGQKQELSFIPVLLNRSGVARSFYRQENRLKSKISAFLRRLSEPYVSHPYHNTQSHSVLCDPLVGCDGTAGDPHHLFTINEFKLNKLKFLIFLNLSGKK